jgi:multiple sugar transport system permease protein
MRGRGRWRKERNGLLFISPWIVGFLFFIAYPIGSSFYYSLTRYNVVDSPVFRGLGNYIELILRDDVFHTALLNTLYMIFVGTTVITVATIAIAIVLNNKYIRGLSFFRIIFFIPTLVPLVILCIVWVWMLQPQTGLINTFLSYIGIKGPGWLADPRLAKPAFIMMFLWTSGGAVIIYLAGLQDIPQSLYEVASLDGAGFFRRTFSITIPMLSPVILFNVVTYVIGIFQSFAESFIITGGGPNKATLFYSLYLYQNAFQYFKMGLACAMAWILLLIAVGLIAFLLAMEKRYGYRQ